MKQHKRFVAISALLIMTFVLCSIAFATQEQTDRWWFRNKVNFWATVDFKKALTLNTATPIVFEGATKDAYETTLSIVDPTADNTIYVPNTSGYLRVWDNAGTDDVNLIFEGATANTYETTLTFTDPTADRTVTVPNASGVVLLDADIANQELLGTAPFVLQGTTDDTFSTTLSVGDPQSSKTVALPHDFNGTLVMVIEHDEAQYSVTNATLDCTSISVPTNEVFHSNMALHFKFAGTVSGTSNQCKVMMYVGDTNVSTLDITNSFEGDFVGEYIVANGTNSATQDIYGFVRGAGWNADMPGDADHATDTTDFASAQTVKLRIVSANALDTITIEHCIVELE